MTIHNTRLEAKVAARNHVNKLAMDLDKKMMEVLKPFVGKKIALACGGLSAKFKAALPKEPEDFCKGGEAWFFRASRYCFSVQCRTIETSKGREADYTLACYAEKDFNLGDLDSKTGVLVKLNESPLVCRTDYSVGEVRELRKQVFASRSAMHAAEYALAGFGEHDNS